MMQTKNTSEISNAVCRNCRFYQPSGHRGGVCEQFDVPVSGAWSTCQLALPAFVPAWKTLEDLPAEKSRVFATDENLTVRRSPTVASLEIHATKATKDIR
jgi:hypothetical protein